MSDQRYARHEGLFGVDGQQRITDTVVGVVGAGGLGMHVAQQLAYLGVISFRLSEFDTVDITNLNRLIGAGPDDVGKPKVEIAARFVRFVQPGADVITVATPFEPEAPKTTETFADADVLFSCVDTEPTRIAALDYASTRQIPLIDLATDIGSHPDGTPWYGGRVVVARGEGCPVCLDAIDQEGLALAAMTDAQRVEHARIYGIPVEALDATGPSVVSINGVVASLGVTEFMALVTGLRAPVGLLTYRAERGIVNASLDTPDPGCHYCSRFRSRSDC
ncbi:MAG: HesA/MoeB/ThiF family protein [Acidimicrobiia bacterium]